MGVGEGVQDAELDGTPGGVGGVDQDRDVRGGHQVGVDAARELGGEFAPKRSGGFGFEDLVESATVQGGEIGGGRLFGDDALVGVFEVILLRLPGGAGAPVQVRAVGGELIRGCRGWGSGRGGRR